MTFTSPQGAAAARRATEQNPCWEKSCRWVVWALKADTDEVSEWGSHNEAPESMIAILQTPCQACSIPLYRRERYSPVGLSSELNTHTPGKERVVTIITLNINSFQLLPLCDLTLNGNSGSGEVRGSSKVTQ